MTPRPFAFLLLFLWLWQVSANIDNPVTCARCIDHHEIPKSNGKTRDIPCTDLYNVDDNTGFDMNKTTSMDGNINWAHGNYTASISDTKMFDKYWREQGSTHIFLANAPGNRVHKIWQLWCHYRHPQLHSDGLWYYLDNDDACQIATSDCPYNRIVEISVFTNRGPGP